MAVGRVWLGTAAAVLAVATLVAAAPVGCRVEVVVDTDAAPAVHDAAAVVADRMTAVGTPTVVRTDARQPATYRLVDLDLSRLRPSWWPGATSTVTLFTGAPSVDGELGRTYVAAGEVVLAAGLAESGLFGPDVWQAAVAHELGHAAGLVHDDGGVMRTGLAPEDMRLDQAGVVQLAAAWCG